MHNSSRAKAKWFVQKEASCFIKLCWIQFFSIRIVLSTLPVSFAVANGDVVTDDPQPFTYPYKATCKLSTVVCPDIAQLIPAGNHIII